MIRIATAHAKLRLSEQVDEVDANDTVQMIRSHLIEKIVKREVKVIRKETKVVEIEKKVGEAEKESSEETTVDEETKLNVMEKIWMWRDSNKGESSVLVEQLASEIKADSKVVRQVALELADSDAIMLEKGTIYFLD
ncbi:hypothetical protein ECANGB1_999 [Enterospora canceri]|uniref:Uncharacterized protein n=1 Tax=Enterospora canceri TaxID=1081671 RepID=A0A1Y1S733_9MICR|nr:hypothetical protein ECANGB1_999 [Enterospora canceri]